MTEYYTITEEDRNTHRNDQYFLRSKSKVEAYKEAKKKLDWGVWEVRKISQGTYYFKRVRFSEGVLIIREVKE